MLTIVEVVGVQDQTALTAIPTIRYTKPTVKNIGISDSRDISEVPLTDIGLSLSPITHPTRDYQNLDHPKSILSIAQAISELMDYQIKTIPTINCWRSS